MKKEVRNNLTLALRKNSDRYDKNYEKMIRVPINSKQHKHFLKMEDIYNRRGIKLQKKLGIYTYDPCPLRYLKNCAECSGYYKRIYIGKGKYLLKETNFGRGIKCRVK